MFCSNWVILNSWITTVGEILIDLNLKEMLTLRPVTYGDGKGPIRAHP